MTDPQDNALNDLFAAARGDRPGLPAALAGRMMSDAMRVQAGWRHTAPTWRAQLAEALGGWFGVGGLAAACAAGIWIGFAPPDGLPDPLNLVVDAQAGLDLFESGTLALALAEDG